MLIVRSACGPTGLLSVPVLLPGIGSVTPLGGVTVVLQGPQGEDATLTDDKGEYHFTSLPVGTYVIRFYVANTAAQVEQGGVMVSRGGRVVMTVGGADAARLIVALQRAGDRLAALREQGCGDLQIVGVAVVECDRHRQ